MQRIVCVQQDQELPAQVAHAKGVARRQRVFRVHDAYRSRLMHHVDIQVRMVDLAGGQHQVVQAMQQPFAQLVPADGLQADMHVRVPLGEWPDHLGHHPQPE
ncbi:hypothetical protein D3C72_1465360 [compost metagenome]